MIFKPIINPIILAVLSILSIGLIVFLIVRSPKQKRRDWFIRLATVVLLATMMFRPSLIGGRSNVGLTNFDVIFAIDTTSSMAAEDYKDGQPRLNGVKSDVEKLTKDLAGARFSVMTFDNNATQVLPLTTDTNATVTAAATVSQEITYYSSGSSIDRPLDLLKELFTKSQKENPERVRLLFYFGDGEQTVEQQPKSFESLKSLIDGGAVLGYGTTTGGKMKEFSGYDDTKEVRYIIDYSGNDFTNKEALSKIDEDNLKKIADEFGGGYENRTTATDNIASVKKLNMSKLERSTVDVSATTDLYWIFAIILVILLMIDLRRIVEMNLEIKAGTK